jgi:hypothetical protein
MARLRPLAVLMLLAASTATATAVDSASEKKKPVVREQKFDVPLDFKSRSDFNVGDPASIPSGRQENLSLEPRNPTFFGLGLTRPFGNTK